MRLCLMLRLGNAAHGDVLRHMLRGHMLLWRCRLPRVLRPTCRHLLLLAGPLVHGQLWDVGAVLVVERRVGCLLRHRHGHMGPLWHWAERPAQLGVMLDSLGGLCRRSVLLNSCLRPCSFLWLRPSYGWDCLELSRGLRPGRFKSRLGQGRRCWSCRLLPRHLRRAFKLTKVLLAWIFPTKSFPLQGMQLPVCP